MQMSTLHIEELLGLVGDLSWTRGPHDLPPHEPVRHEEANQGQGVSAIIGK